jgi:hypothetical protein
MLGEYIGQVNALVTIYAGKLQELPSLKQQKDKIDEENQQILSIIEISVMEFHKIEKTIKELELELSFLIEREKLVPPLMGGSIKNNDKVNVAMYVKGAKHNIHYIQQYGKAIIQSGGTIKELAESLNEYIIAVKILINSYNIIMQNHSEKNDAIKQSMLELSKTQELFQQFENTTIESARKVDQLKFQIAVLKEKLASTNVSIKSLVDTMCNQDMVTDKEGGCHKSLQQIDSILHRVLKKNEHARIVGYDRKDEIKFYKSIKDNNKDQFISLLKSEKKYSKRGTLLQLIGLNNIKVILENKKVTVGDKHIDVSDEQFYSANILLTNNEEAIGIIAYFFYEKPLIPLLP